MEPQREIIKEYTNGDLTVIWKPKSCIHAAECVKRLPNVYDPNAKPWIKAENASILFAYSRMMKQSNIWNYIS